LGVFIKIKNSIAQPQPKIFTFNFCSLSTKAIFGKENLNFIMKLNFCLTIFFISAFLSSCKQEDKPLGQLLQTVHQAMLKQDSLMKAAHDKLNKRHVEWGKEYSKAGGKLDSSQAKIEIAHVKLLEKHDDIIDKHEVILKMHKRLIEKYNNGKIDKEFIEEEHKLLEEEYKLMQMDHTRLLEDHDKLESDHENLIKELRSVGTNQR
jgi:hypothetical protein